ncbi:hypothetical protein [Phenylobacterium montanum]|uniref:Uncharacterized protein n=1 Tax=Phenylobacterium montanum TaxID=2823693 RepID=A0A975FZ14_9CAUL|nr:hypothetical protein [Caulobacter sp. S6]QUD86936.1 hypothetical protein KCG34_17930 [Caulobacter sp. S6]
MQIEFVGASGATYRYFPRNGQRLSPSGGNFIYARDTVEGLVVVYAGEAESLAATADDRWTEAQAKFGATHAFVRLNVTAAVRRQELADIIGAYAPPMNALAEH